MFGGSWLREQARRESNWRFEAALRKGAVPWRDDVPWRGGDLLIDAATWRPDTLFNVKAGGVDASNKGLVRRRWRYRHVVLPRGEALEVYQSKKRGYAYFTADVVIPQITDLDFNVWMSITPMEVLTLRQGVSRARGRVVIGGLGMGWFLKKVCARPQVREVVVVEKDGDLLNWFGRRLCAAQPKVREVVHGDVLDHVGRDPEAVYLLDIWKRYGFNGDEPQIKAAKAKGAKVWCWGSCDPGGSGSLLW